MPTIKKSVIYPMLVGLFLTSCAENKSPEMAPVVKLNSLTEAEAADGWTLLFDGQNMAQWRGFQSETMPEGWTVVDGAMVMTQPEHGGDIVTRETFQNFELMLEWKVGDGGNSGIMFHVSEDFDTPWATGPEMQILDNVAFEGGAVGKNSAGSNYDVHPPSHDVSKPAGEWNTVRLVVNGPSVEHWMNGDKIVEYQLWTEEWRTLVDGSKWVNYADYGMRPTGHIALQGDHTAVSFRNLKVKRLPDSEVADQD